MVPVKTFALSGTEGDDYGNIVIGHIGFYTVVSIQAYQ